MKRHKEMMENMNTLGYIQRCPIKANRFDNLMMGILYRTTFKNYLSIYDIFLYVIFKINFFVFPIIFEQLLKIHSQNLYSIKLKC